MNHFSDPTLQDLLEKVEQKFGALPAITPAEPDGYFTHLSESIISQQLSTKVADVIAERARNLLGGSWSPELVLQQEHDTMRAVGLSNSKVKYLKNLAAFWTSSDFHPAQLSDLPDEEVIARLTTISGIGRWTVEMFLIFSLGRPDVFSPGDGGLRRAALLAYNLSDSTKPQELSELAQSWAPQRSLASRVLWKSLEL